MLFYNQSYFKNKTKPTITKTRPDSSKDLALYKPFTYLLTYLITYEGHKIGPKAAKVIMITEFYLCVHPSSLARHLLHTSIEVDRDCVLRSGLLPRIAESQPIIWLLNLSITRPHTHAKRSLKTNDKSVSYL